MKVRIGTRGSDLALWQAHHVAGQLFPEVETEIVVIKTTGDQVKDRPLHKVEGTSFFTAEIERALQAGEVDLAVHSHKDLATEGPEDLLIAAVPPRAQADECLLVGSAAHDPKAAFLPLKAEAKVGTSSPRRRALLAALRPDLELAELRGNVPTRLQRLREGRYDAVLVARAGVARLGLDLSGLVDVALPLPLAVPAPSQGALAIQVRRADSELAALCRRLLHDEATAAAIAAERAVLVSFGGGCHLALGACVERVDGDADEAPAGAGPFRAFAFSGPGVAGEGTPARWAVRRGSTPAQAADAAAAALREPEPGAAGPLAGLRVVLVGSADDGSALAERLGQLGAVVAYERVLGFQDVGAPGLPARLARLKRGDVLAVTSREAARRLTGERLPPGVVVAAVGPATAKALAAVGIPAAVVGKGGARALADRLEVEEGRTVLFPCAENARPDLPEALAARGVKVEKVVLYRTVPEPGSEAVGEADVRVYMSPSAVASSVALGREEGGADAEGRRRRVVRVGLGGSTCDALQDEGLDHERPRGSGPEATVALLGRLFAGRVPAAGVP